MPDKAAHEFRARFSYHPTAERAQRAAPSTGEVFSVVRIDRKAWVKFPNIEELTKRTRSELPPPEHVRIKSKWTAI